MKERRLVTCASGAGEEARQPGRGCAAGAPLQPATCPASPAAPGSPPARGGLGGAQCSVSWLPPPPPQPRWAPPAPCPPAWPAPARRAAHAMLGVTSTTLVTSPAGRKGLVCRVQQHKDLSDAGLGRERLDPYMPTSGCSLAAGLSQPHDTQGVCGISRRALPR